MPGVNFMWYDGFLLSMLMVSTIIVAMHWKEYHSCPHPFHVWTVVDYTTIFLFRTLMFVDDAIAAGMGVGWPQTHKRFYGRVIVLSIIFLVLYPFLWSWTIIGSLWFIRKSDCMKEDDQSWGVVIWLALSYFLLISLGLAFTRLFMDRRKAHLARAPQGTSVSVFGVLVCMIRVPGWAFEAMNQEMRAVDQENGAHYPGLYMTGAQREAVEVLIQQIPKFQLKTVPDDCNDCPICLEEFQVGNEVRGLPCTHNFHVDCIDKWLRLNVSCPRCRSRIFPDLNTNVRTDSESSTD